MTGRVELVVPTGLGALNHAQDFNINELCLLPRQPLNLDSPLKQDKNIMSLSLPTPVSSSTLTVDCMSPTIGVPLRRAKTDEQQAIHRLGKAEALASPPLDYRPKSSLSRKDMADIAVTVVDLAPSEEGSPASAIDPSSKFPIDTRGPRYSHWSNTDEASAFTPTSPTTEHTIPPADRDKAKAETQSQSPAFNGAQKSNSPFPKSSSRPSEPRTRYATFGGNRMQIDGEGEPACLWSGPGKIEWGSPDSGAQRFDFLIASRKERNTNFYSPTEEECADRHCSEHADTPQKTTMRRAREIAKHNLKHSLGRTCGDLPCCMDTWERKCRIFKK